MMLLLVVSLAQIPCACAVYVDYPFASIICAHRAGDDYLSPPLSHPLSILVFYDVCNGASLLLQRTRWGASSHLRLHPARIILLVFEVFPSWVQLTGRNI